MNGLTIRRNPPTVIWSAPPVRNLLHSASANQAMRLITRLFTLCAEAHKLAASLLLSPGQPPDVRAAQQELAKETLRRALCDWLPAFSGRQASADSWALLRNGQLSRLAERYFFGDDPGVWLQRGPSWWQQWYTRSHGDLASGIAKLLTVRTPAVQMAPHPDEKLLTSLPLDVSPLALEYEQLQACRHGDNFSALRLLARCIALARSLSVPASLRWNCFCADGWHIAVVETARGWLTHQLRWNKRGNIDDYRIISPTERHAHPAGVIATTLVALPEADWQRQLLIIDPCVAVKMIE